MTQELIANMLGVRREGATEGAVKLQQAGLIRYARGRITAACSWSLRATTFSSPTRATKRYRRASRGTRTS
jgi:hypothetical protein